MNEADPISFRPVSEADFHMITLWLNEPHMRAFYQKQPITLAEVTLKYTPRIDGTEPIHMHIVMAGEVPIGKMQCYHIQDYPEYANEVQVREGVADDLFIGNPEYLGRGYGKRMLLGYVSSIVRNRYPTDQHCYITHEKGNEAAIQNSLACGFRILRDTTDRGAPAVLLTKKL